MAEYMRDLWLNITKDRVYKNWKLGVLDGLLYRTGIYDNSPLEKYLEDVTKDVVKKDRRLIISK